MSEFWLGLALSVPIGIGVNIVTPMLQRRAQKIGIEFGTKSNVARHQKAVALSSRMSDLYVFMLQSILEALLTIGVYGSIAFTLWYLGSNVSMPFPVGIIVDYGWQVVAFVALITIFTEVRDALLISREAVQISKQS